MIFRALTVCQPYATMIASGEKPIENRTWPTAYLGPLLIHAGKSLDWLEDRRDKDRFVFGAVVAVATLRVCLRRTSRASELEVWDHWNVRHLYNHRHANGPWCWVLDNVVALETPVPCTGAQGLWVPTSAVTAAVASQLDAMAAVGDGR